MSGNLNPTSAILLANEGAKVVITDHKAEGADDVLEEIRRGGGQAIFMQQEFSKEEDWQSVIEETVDRFGKLGVAVNNAGVGAGKNIEDITVEDLRWVMSVNRDGVFLGTKHAIEAMKQRDGGYIAQ